MTVYALPKSCPPAISFNNYDHINKWITKLALYLTHMSTHLHRAQMSEIMDEIHTVSLL